jgi:aminoglycoside 6'-N-acetyltransferase
LNQPVDTDSEFEDLGVGQLSFRRLERSDFSLLQRWLSLPHVAQWWEHLETLEDVEREFGPCVSGEDPTAVFVIVLDQRDAGIIQTYLLADNPEYEAAVGVLDAAGVDLFIGEPDLLNIGLGRRVLTTFISRVGWSRYPWVKGYESVEDRPRGLTLSAQCS